MSENSAIEWTQRSHQFTAGCLHRSPGCARCYAEKMAYRLACMARAEIAKGKDPGGKRVYMDVIDMETGHWNGRVVPIEESLAAPLKWENPQMVFVDSMSDLFYGDDEDSKRCEAKGIPFTPVPFGFIDRVFARFALTPHVTYQVLTKRAGRMAGYFESLTAAATGWQESLRVEHGRPDAVFTPTNVLNIRHLKTHQVGSPVAGYSTAPPGGAFDAPWPLPNVWIGTSCEDQKRADERIPHLLKCPAAVRFLSCEPMLEDLGDIAPYLGDEQWWCPNCDREKSPVQVTFEENCTLCGEPVEWRGGIHWVIVGCESGPGRRPMKPEWAESIAEQCRDAGVAFFMKQMEVNGRVEHDMAKFPERLRVREFPATTGGER